MKQLFLFLAFLVAPILAFSWGSEGHKMVAGIAKAKVTDSTAARVKRYLGKMTFEEAALWMDELRSNKKYDYMKPWHYVNIEKDATYVKSPKGDVVSELTRVIAELRNYKTMKPDAVAFDLKVLFHLCGDIVQPLHTGYGSDLGGNNVTVFLNKKKTNLHHIWDTDIIVNGKITLESCLAVANGWSAERAAAVRKTDPMAWMLDSRALLSKAYDYKGKTITPEYMAANKPVVEEQIAKGGARLAAVLNDIFGKE